MSDESQIRSVVTTLSTGDDHMAFLTAATLNLYGEALRRVHGRALYGPGDAQAVASIITILFSKTTEHREDITIRTRELTPSEQEAVLRGLTDEVKEPKGEEPHTTAKDAVVAKFNQGRRV